MHSQLRDEINVSKSLFDHLHIDLRGVLFLVDCDLKKHKCPMVGGFSLFLLLLVNLEQYQCFKKGAQNAN